VGLDALVRAVAQDLKGDEVDEMKGGKLKDVWIAGQRYSADMKLRGKPRISIVVGISRF
jgi:hypothetical protein